MRALALVVLTVIFSCCAREPNPKAPEEGAPHRAPSAAAHREEPRSSPEALAQHRFHLALGNPPNIPAGREFVFAEGSHFPELTEPHESDWLANHKEPGQTFPEFRQAKRNLVTRQRSTIYLLPLGPSSTKHSPTVPELAEFIEIYFGLDVKIMKAIWDEDELGVRMRARRTGRQLLAPDVLDALKKRIPSDAYCLIAITALDLYPRDSWNFVFGLASLRERVGVQSFARYEPEFYGQTANEDVRATVWRRSLRLVSHELGHMFGMKHCVHHSCNMQGSNHLDEFDNQPLHLGPVCLRKLYEAKPFDAAERYARLGNFYRKHGLEDDAWWAEQRAQALTE